MKKWTLIAILLLTFEVSVKAEPGFWPDGKKAAIVLTYDDGLDSQLDFAIPQLNQYNLKGTFYIYGFISETSIPRWRNVSLEGHELGNHSIFHPCLGNGNKNQSPRSYSENYDVPSILREIGVMNKFLFAITGKTPTSYGYPCSETTVGGVDYSEGLKASGLVRFARSGGNREIITDFKNLNYFKVPTYGVLPGANSAADLIDYSQKVLAKEGLGVLIFHGVGGDYLNVEANDHLGLLKFLDEHPEIWVATFSEVMEYVQQKEKPTH